MSHVQTVLGPVDPATLGGVMPHEHLGLLAPGAIFAGGAGDDRVSLSVLALSRLKDLGFGTLVDLTPIGFPGRDANVLRDISRETGLHIVASASFYLEPYSPEFARKASLDEIEELFVGQATEGIDGTDIRIGVLGEQATGLDEITAHEEKCLRAAGRAHRRTGLSINTHCTHGTMAMEQIRILREEGVDLSRVILGHMDQAGIDTVQQVINEGVAVAYDTFGKEFWDFVLEPMQYEGHPEGEFAKRGYHRSDASRVAEVAELVRRGYADRLLLSQDMSGHEAYLNPSTHGTYGYAFLGEVIVPRLREAGVSDRDLDQMMVQNPARFLTVD
jgi:predicted metal-dependent phosphotriesterase family hydrolase